MIDPATASLIFTSIDLLFDMGLKMSQNKGRLNPDDRKKYIKAQAEVRKALVAEANDLVTPDSNEGGDPTSTLAVVPED